MNRIGLVLGAGGVVGQAYHAGVLAALEHDLGWDPRTADLIVGSSAGSITGTLLRLGTPAADLVAWALEAPPSVESAALMEQLTSDETNEIPALAIRDLLHGWRLPAPALLVRTARRPWAFRPSVAALTLLPTGRVDVESRAAVLQAVTGETWPQGLWICAARRDDGGRVVFGRRGSPRATVAAAVAASCAIPGYFSPVRIRGVEYFDGGVHSPTNADVLRHAELDLVIVVSPMSAAHGRSLTVDAAVRWAAHRRLEQEVRKLQSTGTTVLRFEPGPRSLAAMGLNAMSPDRSDRVIQQAFVETSRRAARGHVAERLASVAVRESRRLAPA